MRRFFVLNILFSSCDVVVGGLWVGCGIGVGDMRGVVRSSCVLIMRSIHKYH